MNKINFSNPGHLKLAILSQGINPDAIKTFNRINFAENTYQYGNGNKPLAAKGNYPAYMVLEDETNVGLNYRNDSPWSLSYNAESSLLFLTYQDKKITPAKLAPQPNFYNKRMKNNDPVTKVIGLYGLHCLTFFVRGSCLFINKNLGCKFCSLGQARKKEGKKNVVETTPELAKEALEIAFEQDQDIIEYINYSSGTDPNFNNGFKKQYAIMTAIKEVLPKEKYIKQHALIFPPKDKSHIKKLLDAGLGSLNYSLEIFDKKLFREICPGKAQYLGYEGFIQAFKDAVEIMGHGKMYVNFVGGLEPLESLLKGINYFADLGIAASVNVFHPDKGTALENKAKPSIDYLLEMTKEMSRVYKKYNFTCIYPKGGTRNSLDTEVWKGYFDD